MYGTTDLAPLKRERGPALFCDFNLAPPPSLRRRVCAVALLAFAFVGPPAAAHKLEVFAFADGSRIEGQVYIAGGVRAPGARIIVRDAAGRTLTEISPAADGSFSFAAQAAVDHWIVAESGDGHRAEWRVAASELAGGVPGQESPGRVNALAPPAPAVTPTDATATEARVGAGQALDPMLEAAIERAVARQVRPLRQELAVARDAARLQDILGAIGYIFGLTGAALWWHGRRPSNRQ